MRILLFTLTVLFCSQSLAVELTKTEMGMVKEINKYREKRDLPPLKVDDTLVKVARSRVAIYSHKQHGRMVWEDCKRWGFKGFATDNLCQDAITPQEAVDGWAESTVGHAEQMQGYFNMNRKWVNWHFDKVGVAHTGRNWIAIFGKEDKESKSKNKPARRTIGPVFSIQPWEKLRTHSIISSRHIKPHIAENAICRLRSLVGSYDLPALPQLPLGGSILVNSLSRNGSVSTPPTNRTSTNAVNRLTWITRPSKPVSVRTQSPVCSPMTCVGANNIP
jgi:hypothetical protein